MTGLELVALRESLGLTQTRLAAELDVYQSTIIKWEKRDRLPRRTELAILAVAEQIRRKKETTHD